MNNEVCKYMNNMQPRWAKLKKEKFMPIAGLILMLVWFCGIMLYAGYAKSQSQSSRSYQIFKLKAAFLYNFIRFVEWPEEKMSNEGKPIVIGIIGKDSFGNVLEPLKGKKIKGRKVILKRFKSFGEIKQLDENTQKKELKAIGQSHLLFVCNSEKSHISELTKSIREYNILTVGDMKNFLENGGIINFTMEQNKIRFDVNVTAAKDSNLKIRSQLLRLAKTVIKKDTVTTDSGGS